MLQVKGGGIIMKSARKFVSGFTLIELLIVIALLGALAIGLLATVDPIEQIQKGRDTSIRNTMAEFHSANLRYYAVKSAFPWNISGTVTTLSAVGADTLNTEIGELIAAGELKTQFSTVVPAATLAKLKITSETSDTLAACYMPESKSFQKDANTLYDSSGVATTGCKSQTSGAGGTDCYYCIQ